MFKTDFFSRGCFFTDSLAAGLMPVPRLFALRCSLYSTCSAFPQGWFLGVWLVGGTEWGRENEGKEKPEYFFPSRFTSSGPSSCGCAASEAHLLLKSPTQGPEPSQWSQCMGSRNTTSHLVLRPKDGVASCSSRLWITSPVSIWFSAPLSPV